MTFVQETLVGVYPEAACNHSDWSKFTVPVKHLQCHQTQIWIWIQIYPQIRKHLLKMHQEAICSQLGWDCILLPMDYLQCYPPKNLISIQSAVFQRRYLLEVRQKPAYSFLCQKNHHLWYSLPSQNWIPTVMIPRRFYQWLWKEPACNHLGSNKILFPRNHLLS